MEIVDCHVHAGVTKYVPAEVLLAQMEVAGIDKAVLVQYGGQYDNRYEQEMCQKYPGKFAPWGMVDTSGENAAGKFTEAVEEHGMVGFRVPVNARSNGDNPFAFWQQIESLEVVVSLSGNRESFGAPETAELIEKHPGIKFRIEHLGQPRLDEGPPFLKAQKVYELSRFPNVFIAYSGLYAASKEGHPYHDLVPFLKMIYDAFGPRRIMWGSDFPPVCLKETVQMNLELFKDGFSFLNEEDKEWILGKTAQSFTRFL